MSDALNNATKQSLVLVDEFGKGTETVSAFSVYCRVSSRHFEMIYSVGLTTVECCVWKINLCNL